ncbi:hypothetical protein [Halobacterium litoreum]|uniref:Uncharacterized protein n=1 Tax=Halobacterium litoreum TaxID=2039234 RepID=A0ABD5NCU6_9EURY|nr:hypothetical protein [Halobacterium litoreum]UHH14034.1 hypothetical protein LT972_03310 [Halobacterium litoreum]
MSTPSRSALADAASDAVKTPASATLLKPFEVAGFWAAVALPFLYLPLVVSGPATSAEQTALVALVGAHVLSLLLGHRHRAE